jgi:hypothetical protein
MRQTQIETVGKVFIVTCGTRRCLICDRVFTPMQAAEHSSTICVPATTEAEAGRRYTDQCFPFLSPTDSSS